MTTNARVLVVQRRLTHYRVPFFGQLRSELKGRGMSLSLAYGSPTAGEARKQDGATLDWATTLKTNYLLGDRVCWQPFAEVAKAADVVVIAHENKLVYNLIHQYGARGQRVVLWGHGANLQGDESTLRERIKRVTAGKADWWLGYTEVSRPLIERSFPSSRITVLNNTIDTCALASECQDARRTDMKRIRDSLGIRGDMVGAFVGSLYKEKRISFLLECAAELHRRHDQFELLIAGAGPDAELVESFCSRNAWAHYLGAVGTRRKAETLVAADVLLNPGLVGLGIMDAFVCCCPIVTTDCGLHSPEIAYLKSGINGLMTENSLESYVDGVERVLVDAALRTELGRGCEESAAMYSLESMATKFADGVEGCLRAPGYRHRS